jgi:hypothetical protein
MYDVALTAKAADVAYNSRPSEIYLSPWITWSADDRVALASVIAEIPADRRLAS